MERIPVPKGVNTETEGLLNSIMDTTPEILDLSTKLETAPTTANGSVKESQFALYSGNLYVTINGNCYRIQLTAV